VGDVDAVEQHGELGGIQLRAQGVVGTHANRPVELPNDYDAVRTALAEDLGPGDATTLACIPLESRSLARMMAREDLTVAGLQFA
jgi:hypothetical protein